MGKKRGVPVLKAWRRRRIGWILTAVWLVLSPFCSAAAYGNGKGQPVVSAAGSPERTVTLVGTLQDELGHTKEWDPSAAATVMHDEGDGLYTLTGTLPAGTYEYKIAINGSWDENYGAGGRNGGNLTLTLNEPTKVTFYYHDRTHAIADSTWYAPIPKEKQPRLVGTVLPAIGHETDNNGWTPATSTAFLKDDDFDSVYALTAQVPKGSYEYKIVLGTNWDENYPQENARLNVLETTTITFFFNAKTKEVYTDYRPQGSDGIVQKERLKHNTWDALYRQPFGAVKAGTKVTLRLAAKKGDLTKADVYVKNTTTGTANVYTMEKVGVLGDDEYWEAVFTPSTPGVYGYKFIAQDAGTKVEYGEDTQEGQWGKAVDSRAELFQLTVYDPDYRTPDWMKEAVVYQIFPDRFFNGNPSNDNSKQQARGTQSIEHRAWSELPDNPRLKGTSGYDGDGEWSNDFFGGDIAGIEQKLDYLQSIGVNTIYLNPIANAPSNHKYDASNYKELDPMFGSPEEFQSFVQALANRGMHLILDGVFNHVSDDSIYFDRYHRYPTVGAYEYWEAVYDLMNEKGLSEEEARKQAEEKFKQQGQTFSPYGFHLWFNIENEKVDGRYKYQSWWGYDSLPEFKSVTGEKVPHPSELNNDALANYIFRESDSVAKSWIARGASGWRLDVANEVDPAFWREFRQELLQGSYDRGPTLKEGEQPLILGEIWDDASKYFLGDQYDSVMNYRFRGAVLDFLKNGNAEEADKRLTAIREDYPSEAFYALMNLIGSHDTARAVFLLGNGTDSSERAEFDPNYNEELGKKRLKLAAILQMGYPGAPTIYYGDEAGVTGSKDPDNRRTYPWGKEDQNLLSHYQKVGHIRQHHQSLLAHGDIKTVYAQGDVYVFARQYGREVALIAVNRGNEDKTVALDVASLLPNGTVLTDELHDGGKATVAGGTLTVTIPALDGRMMFGTVTAEMPAAVSKLKASAAVGRVTLTWEGKASKYRVYQSTIQGAGYTLAVETNETSVTIDSLANGTAYYFAVTAVDENGNESPKVETNRVVPHYPLTSDNVQFVTTLSDATLDLSKPQQVDVHVNIDGVTSKGAADGLQAVLQVKGQHDEAWKEYRAVYQGQDGDANVFRAAFTPLVAGTYTYRYALTTNLGEDWVYTEAKQVTFTADSSDQKAPAEAIELTPPPVESGQVHLSWQFVGKDDADAYLLVIERNGTVIHMTTSISTSFVDYGVENGTEYAYVVKLYDRAGNVTASNTVKVKPDIMMVKVIFKVKAPDYTPLDARITIPNSLNGWNTGAWEMSRNGAVTPDWQFTTEVQEGETITYKYVKGGSWDQEGLADHTPADNGDDDVSYYGYGSIGTDLKVTVRNEGNNTMVVEDRILRWIDMPVVIEEVKKQGSQVTIKGNAIKNGVLTINGERVPINDQMAFVYTFTPAPQQKEVAIHIEPSAESKAAVFKNDGGAIAKNTKDYVLNLETKQLREGTLSLPPSNGGMPGSGTTPGGTAPENGVPTDGEGAPVKVEDGKVIVKPAIETKEQSGKVTEKTASISARDVDNMIRHLSEREKEIVVSVGNIEKGQKVKIVVPASLFQQASEKVSRAVIVAETDKVTYKLPVAEIQTLLPDVAKDLGVDIGKINITIGMTVTEAPALPLKVVSDAVAFHVTASAGGKEKNIDRFSQYVEREVTVQKAFQPTRAVAVRLNEDGTVTAVPTLFVGNKAIIKSLTNSTYIVVEGSASFRDTTTHWAKQYIETLAAKQMVKGISVTTYAPNAEMTRAQFAVLLARALGLPSAVYDGRFKDVKGEEWFARTGEWMAAVQYGIIQGKRNRTFGPDEPITRAQAAVMIERAMKLPFVQYDFAQLDQKKTLADFKDQGQIGSWAKEAVETIYQAGIVHGKANGDFGPNEGVTRAQMAKILYGFLKNAKLMP
ncbi:amylopullulanase [Geobacillus lituanicus]|nr:amylopullulanase [Geobacillus lituanicus]